MQMSKIDVQDFWQISVFHTDTKYFLIKISIFFRFFAMVRNLVLWMDDLMRQMKTSEKPRDVSGVELLMNNHQVCICTHSLSLSLSIYLFPFNPLFTWWIGDIYRQSSVKNQLENIPSNNTFHKSEGSLPCVCVGLRFCAQPWALT